jgi:hypothetical protein
MLEFVFWRLTVKPLILAEARLGFVFPPPPPPALFAQEAANKKKTKVMNLVVICTYLPDESSHRSRIQGSDGSLTPVFDVEGLRAVAVVFYD